MITVDTRSRVPLYEQIINSIKELAVAGVLDPNEKLPSVRDLAKTLTVNPNTIQKAYNELERQGLIYVERGKGTFISDQILIANKEKKMKILSDNIRQVLVDCIYLGLEKKEVLDEVDKIYDEITKSSSDSKEGAR